MHLLDCVTILCEARAAHGTHLVQVPVEDLRWQELVLVRPVLAHLLLLVLPSHAPAVTGLPLFLSLQHMASCITTVSIFTSYFCQADRWAGALMADGRQAVKISNESAAELTGV